MRIIIAVALSLWLATPAWGVKKIATIGDSHPVGGTTFPDVGSFLARWRLDVTLGALLSKQTEGQWAGAIVESWGVPGTDAFDWLEPGPSSAPYCTGDGEPWWCCTGVGTGNGCLCELDIPSRYPQAKAACESRRPMTEYLPKDIDLWIYMPDGAGANLDLERTIDGIVALRDALDEIDAGDGVIVSSPVRLGETGYCIALTETYGMTRDEMLLRGLITGPDFWDGSTPPITRCPDLLHPPDTEWAWVADLFLGYLP